jgi:DNA-binding CsgD family transcriptional regulator
MSMTSAGDSTTELSCQLGAILNRRERQLCTWWADGVAMDVMAQWLRVDVRTVRRRLVAARGKLAAAGLSLRQLKGPPVRTVRSLRRSLLRSI